jgi:hypothetical protein
MRLTTNVRDNDSAGLWSTFIIEVGTPGQPARVLISTANDESWVVAPAGCPGSYGTDCPAARGLVFDAGNSNSWSNISIRELDLELNLGYNST